MKIRDKQGGFKQVKMKAEVLDTLPINSVVDYDGETVPEGWEQVQESYELLGGTNVTTTGSVDVFTFNPNLYKRIIYRCGSNEEGDSGAFEIINGVILNPVIHFYDYADATYNISGYVKIITNNTTNTMVIRTRQMSGWSAINFKFYGIKI